MSNSKAAKEYFITGFLRGSDITHPKATLSNDNIIQPTEVDKIKADLLYVRNVL